MARKQQTGRYLVQTDEGERRVESLNAGLSLATTLATRAKRSCSYRVKDALGSTVGYARQEEGGRVVVVRL